MAFFNPGANASADSLFISLDNSPTTSVGTFSGQYLTGQLVYDSSGNLIDLDANQTIASSLQNKPGFSVASESVNLGGIGILNSSFGIGTNGSISVFQLGSTEARTTNAASSGNAYAGAVQNLDQGNDALLFSNAGGGIINTNGFNQAASPISPVALGAYGAYGNSDILIGRQGQINVSVDNDVIASALSNNGIDASGEDLGDWGIPPNPFIPSNPLGAFSDVDGGSLATAVAGNTYGIFNTSIFVGGGTGSTNTVNANLTGATSATAKVGEIDASDNFTGGRGNAVAIAGLDLFYNDQYSAISSGGFIDSSSNPTGPMVLNFGRGANTVIGRAGTGPGTDPIFLGATARTGIGNASAFSSADQFGGITQSGVLVDSSSNSAPGLQILIAGDGTVEGTSKGNTEAIATTGQGNAFAVTQVDEVFGIVDNNNVLNSEFGPGGFGSQNFGAGSAVLIEGAGSIAAGASIASNAFAASDTLDPSGGIAYARTDNSYVIGLSQGGIVESVDASGNPTSITPGIGIGGDGNLRIFADSTQTATAISNFSGNDPSGNVDPFAASAIDDVVVGILDTQIQIGGDLTDMPVVSQLNAQSNAFSISDIAESQSGEDSVNYGIRGSELTVAGDANSNVFLDPSGNRVRGPITVDAQSSFITFAGTSGNGQASDAESGINTRTVGIEESAIGIGGDGRIVSQAINTLSATAGLVLPVSEQGVVDQDPSGVPGVATSDAYAEIGGIFDASGNYRSAGISDSTIIIEKGSLPNTIGGPILNTRVEGKSQIEADAFATTQGTDPGATDGAVAFVDLLSDGIELSGANAATGEASGIKIKQDGNIVGSSVIVGSSIAENGGTGLINGSGSDASAFADINADGLDLGDDGNYAVVGQNGSIFGTSTLGLEDDPFLVSAEAAGGDALAEGEFSLSGIELGFGALLSPGQQSGNLYGEVFSNTQVTAQADQGEAKAISDVSGIAINSQSPQTINLGSGNVTAISQVINNVQSYNAEGTAEATAITDAFGIRDTVINFAGNGSVFASAGGTSIAISGVTPNP
ncbi:hypothetical protein [Synechococcus sp. CBW1006]|uniref:beta strand repeat-containing protein n=1 Tax=Synechococcus sp. CBW1006 TaxID=1353138 RepID=UPI0018CE1B6B|nr:hypothetical protein [Synechococcus sp. CBW1006]QPN66970.1 hypothetical protein H8F26_01280 [Synechococcus sp. CBW1006]